MVAAVIALAGCGPSSDALSVPDRTTTPTTWAYYLERDKMRDTASMVARLYGEEQFEDLIGRHAQPTKLVLVSRGKAVDAYIENPNLQFTCSPYSATYISAKFDDGPVRRFRCTDEATSQYGVAFVSDGARFASAVQKSKTVMIEAEVFQRGNVQMTFTTAALKPDWRKQEAPPPTPVGHQ